MKFTVLIAFAGVMSLSCGAQNEKKKTESAVSERTGGLLIPNETEFSEIPYSLTGVLKKDDNQEKVIYKPKIDLSLSFPPAGDQGYLPTCVPWVLSYGIRSAQQKSLSKWEYNITQGAPAKDRVFSPSYIYNLVAIKGGRSNCPSGMSFETAIKIVTRQGFSFWKDFDYDGENNNCQLNPLNYVSYGSKYANVAYERINIDQTSIKSYLSQNCPVILGIKLDKYFEKDGFSAFENKQPYLYSAKGPANQYHAVICVGYDETTNLFKIMNSYGNNWGDSGFFYIQYKDFDKIVRTGYISWITSIDIKIDYEAFQFEQAGVIEKNKARKEKFDTAKTKKFEDFRITNIGYDSIQKFTVFRFDRDEEVPLIFILRTGEKKIISLNKTKSVYLSLITTDSLQIKKEATLEIIKTDYKSDDLIENIKHNIKFDANEILKLKQPSLQQKSIVERARLF